MDFYGRAVLEKPKDYNSKKNKKTINLAIGVCTIECGIAWENDYDILEYSRANPFILYRNILMIIFSVLCTIVTAISRVYLRYHTMLQVCAGLGVGILHGMIWHQFVQKRVPFCLTMKSKDMTMDKKE